MSYLNNTPNGKLLLGTVKWSNDHKNVMLFANKTARDEFFNINFALIKNNVIYYSPNQYIDVRGRIKHIEHVNYAYFINDSDISTRPYCCFVTNYDYISPDTTRLYIQLDVFQMYIYDVTFYQSYIERAIVKKSSDTLGKYVLPEPITSKLEYESQVASILTEDVWQPIWCLHSASYYNTTDGNYHYEGIGTNNTYGEYVRFIESQEEIKTLLRMYGRASITDALAQIVESVEQAATAATSDNNQWTETGKNFLKAVIRGILSGGIMTTDAYNDIGGMASITDSLSLAQFQDHRDELVGLYAIPLWLKNQYVASGGNENYGDNIRTTVNSAAISINQNSLANGYTPRNKKLLTSVCRAYVLANRAGFRKALKPELFSANPVIELTGITTSTGGYQYHVTNYGEITDSFGEIPYTSERRVGYDSNTGVNKALALLNAGTSIAGGVAALGSGNLLGGAAGVIGGAVSAVDAVGAQGGGFGNNGDLLRITGDRPQLRFYEVNPSLESCQAIDNFFDMYGYSIQKHLNPASYIRSRSRWNYVETRDINLTVPAPADYENELKAAFNSGVTFWHNYETFGIYTQNETYGYNNDV